MAKQRLSPAEGPSLATFNGRVFHLSAHRSTLARLHRGGWSVAGLGKCRIARCELASPLAADIQVATDPRQAPELWADARRRNRSAAWCAA
jgi:hypothetical protein